MASGKIYCWGANEAGQVGAGNTSVYRTPAVVELNALEPLSGATDLSAGGGNTCAVAEDNVYCWGDNSEGSVGHGAPTSVVSRALLIRASVPGVEPPTPRVGSGHSCYAEEGGGLCWGVGADYQLGNLLRIGSAGPIGVSNVSAVTAIAAIGTHTCASVSGGLACWGKNNYSQLGAFDAGMDPGNGAVFVGAVKLPKSGNLSEHTCIISNTELYCSGRNDSGQSGRAVEVLVENFSPVTFP